jgi:hypothetical protein
MIIMIENVGSPCGILLMGKLIKSNILFIAFSSIIKRTSHGSPYSDSSELISGVSSTREEVFLLSKLIAEGDSASSLQIK